MIPIFKILYSNCMIVFAFDNSSNHVTFNKDALIANKMNLGLGEKQPIIWDIYFRPNNNYNQ